MPKLWSILAPRNSHCHAKGQTCHKCSKPNHYARVCRGSVPSSRQPSNPDQLASKNTCKQNIRNVGHQEGTFNDSSSSSDDEYSYSCVNAKQTKMPTAKVKINNVNVTMIIDTGASVNIIDEQTFARVNANKNIRMQRTCTKIFAYGSEQHLPALGKFEMTIKRITASTIHVVKGNYGYC